MGGLVDASVREWEPGACMSIGITAPNLIKVVSNEIIFDASNTTVSKNLFRITGRIAKFFLSMEVTEAISSNHTAGHFRLEGSGGSAGDTLTSNVALSSAPVGTVIVAIRVIVPVVHDGAQCRFEADTLHSIGSFTLLQPMVGETDIFLVWRHTTTNIPESGRAIFTLWYQPYDGATVSPV